MIKVVNPSVELWKQDGYTLDAIWKHIARCARVCYQSTPKNNGEDDYSFLVRTLFRGVEPKDINTKDLVKYHLSVCEHATVHLKYPLFIARAAAQATRFIHNHYSRTREHEGYIYVTTNMRVLIEHHWMNELEFIDNTPNCPYYIPRPTVCFITDIGASRELNRHRVNSVSEESTRYCVSGDTKLKFKNPHLHYTIKEFYDNFVNLQRSQLEYLNEDTGELLFGPANKVFYNGKKEVYNVVTKLGYSLKCTIDHKIYTPNGYVELKDLSVGDKVYVNGTETTVLYRDKSWFENQYITLGKTVKEIANEFGYSKYVIDKNHNNNNPENLISLCSSCHTRVHNQSLLVIYADEIVSITKIGIEDVYDIEMPNYHNYVANGIIVHNCAYDKGKFGNGITVAKLPWIKTIDTNDEFNVTTYNNGFYSDEEIYDKSTHLIEAKNTDNWVAVDWFLYGLQICDLVYRKTRELGWTAQQAREILPLNTKTQVVHTAFVDDWEHWIALRSSEISGKVHPMMSELAKQLVKQVYPE